MRLQIWVGVLLFFGLPIVLWAIGTAAVKRQGIGARIVAFIAGSDNRLSLSRLQAFLWTLVIFGSFAAAMAIHTKISPITTQESKDRIEKAKAEASRAAEAVTAADARVNEYRKKVEEAARAKAEAVIKAGDAKSKAEASPGNAELATASNDAATRAKDAATGLTLAEKLAAQSVTEAEEARKAKATADTAAAVSGNDWVKIPPELLALAGIAIGSGVFSSLISAVKSEDKTACVTSVQVISCSDYKQNSSGPWNAPAAAPYCLVIKGTDMAKEGQVRFNSTSADIIDWKDDGTLIVVGIPDKLQNNPTLIVDTGNGKLCYKLAGTVQNFTLMAAVSYYEFSDLFRDDKNPRGMDLMKFQMFGWTLVAIVIYAWLFLSNLHDHIETLPRVDQSIVILTGLSQGGYLSGKAVTNINRPPTP